MPRPRTSEPRQHQLNVRFTARELHRIHQHAALTGKTLTEFGRSVMLRRPRPRPKTAPHVLTLPPERLERWRAIGNQLNRMAHDLNARHQLDPHALRRLLTRLRRLLCRSFLVHVGPLTPIPAYALAPAARTQLRKTCTNLVQIADRYRLLGLAPPLPLSNLIGRLRAILNGDQSVHGP